MNPIVIPTHCPNCEKPMHGTMTCSNCGWQVNAPKRPPKWLQGLTMWAAIFGLLGGCGFLAYTAVGALFGFGLLGRSRFFQVLAFVFVGIWVLGWLKRAMRR